MSSSEGVLVRGFADQRTVRLLAVDVATAAERTRRAHGLGPDAARFAAEGLVASVLMSAQIKGEERITLQIQNSRPRFAFMGEADSEGNVRARLSPPDVHYPTSGLIEGMMLAIKADAKGEIYRGHSLIAHPSLEQALGEHLRRSNQVDAVLRVMVVVAADGEVRRALGLVVERMPSDPARPSITSEEFVARWGELAEMSADEILAGVRAGEIGGKAIEVLERRPLQWRCRCSRRKVEGVLLALGEQTLRELIEVDQGTEVSCHFCNETYRFEADDLVALVARLSEPPVPEA